MYYVNLCIFVVFVNVFIYFRKRINDSEEKSQKKPVVEVVEVVRRGVNQSIYKKKVKRTVTGAMEKKKETSLEITTE